jgi:hypothetical protein
MRTIASTKSRALKRGTDKKVAKMLGVECCLSQMCGSLHLEAMTRADYVLLTAIYRELFWPRDESKPSGETSRLQRQGQESVDILARGGD